MAASDPSTTSCQQGSADSSCPSKYQCYNQSPHGYFDSEDSQSNQCLCNRHAMFYGQDCLKTHFLAFLTFGLISILMLKCCVRFFSALEAQLIVPPRRRKGTHLVLASISFSLGCLSFLSMTLMNFLRLFTVGAGFELWFRDRGFLYFIFVSMCFFNVGALFVSASISSQAAMLVGALKPKTATLMTRIVLAFKVLFTSRAVYVYCQGTIKAREGVAWSTAAVCFSIGSLAFTSKHLNSLARSSRSRYHSDQTPCFRAAMKMKKFIRLTLHWVFYTLLLAVFYLTIDADSSAISSAMINLTWFCLNLAVCRTMSILAEFLNPESPRQRRMEASRWWSFARRAPPPKVAPGGVEPRSSSGPPPSLLPPRKWPSFSGCSSSSAGAGAGAADPRRPPLANGPAAHRQRRPRLPARHGVSSASGGGSRCSSCPPPPPPPPRRGKGGGRSRRPRLLTRLAFSFFAGTSQSSSLPPP